jgi:hypothetical protein
LKGLGSVKIFLSCWWEQLIFFYLRVLVTFEFNSEFLCRLKPLLGSDIFLTIFPNEQMPRRIYRHETLGTIFDEKDKKDGEFVSGEEFTIHVRALPVV